MAIRNVAAVHCPKVFMLVLGLSWVLATGLLADPGLCVLPSTGAAMAPVAGLEEPGAMRFVTESKARRAAADPQTEPRSGDAAEADGANTLVMSYKLGLLTAICRNVPAGEFFFELSRRTQIPVRIEAGADYTITATVQRSTIDRALETMLPAGAVQVIRKPSGTAIAAIIVKARPQTAGTGPVSAAVGAINLNPTGPGVLGSVVIDKPAHPIHIMTDEELRADPTVDEAAEPVVPVAPAARGAAPVIRR